MERKNKNKLKSADYLIIAVLTFVAAMIAFTYLGSGNVPKTSISKESNLSIASIIVDTGDNNVNALWIYQGIGNTAIQIQSYDELFGSRKSSEIVFALNENMYRWHSYPLKKAMSRYVKITYYAPKVEIFELAFADNNGNVFNIDIAYSDGSLDVLFDEQHLIPSNPSLMTDMYFDELYHARTALEFIRGDYPYENTHPPLGKIIISWGIRLFGMNPFGWRFMNALFSVLLIPLFYYFIFRVTRSTMWSMFGTFIFIMDGMRIVMGRIATLDTFSVFFNLAAFLFMYIYFRNFTEKEKFVKWAIPLSLSGIIWGISAAVKWTGVYAGAGLFIIFMFAVIKWLNDYYHSEREKKLLIADKYVIANLSALFGLCLVFFIAVPFVIYLLSYIPFKEGLDTTDSLYKVMLDNQKLMYEYHSKLTADHPYGSRWYVWLFNAKPVYFYLGEDYLKESVTAKIFAFGNYTVWIIGLFCIGFTVVKIIQDGIGRLKTQSQLSYKEARFKDDNIIMLVMYLSLLVPWIFVTRVAFMYHYYGCVPPLIIITTLVLRYYWNNGETEINEDSRLRYCPIIVDNGKLIAGRLYTVLYFICVIITFIICYPLFTGIPVDWFILSLL